MFKRSVRLGVIHHVNILLCFGPMPVAVCDFQFFRSRKYMIFGTRFGANAPARPTPVRLFWQGMIAVCCFSAMIAPIAGCSGGSSSAIPGGPARSGNGIITGRIVDNRTGNTVAGAQVIVNGQTFVTGEDGTFRIEVPAGRSDLSVRIVGSSTNPFYDTGRYSETNISLGTTGIPLAPINGGEEVSLGDLRVYLASDPPPPPPI
jgi:hypothetical protein